MHLLLSITVLCALSLLSSATLAATVYRWVDDQGKTHYSDVVPERYKSKAEPVNTSAVEPTADQKREAVERAERENAKASARTTTKRLPNVSKPPASATSQPPSKRPAQIPNEQTDCETWQRLYMESIDCFGPYRTVRGGIKPEAFDACNVVPEPPPNRCRMYIP